MLEQIHNDKESAAQCRALADEVESALRDYAVVNPRGFGEIYAYEVDAFVVVVAFAGVDAFFAVVVVFAAVVVFAGVLAIYCLPRESARWPRPRSAEDR